MDIQTIYTLLIKDVINFYHSTAFTVIKFIIAIYVMIVLVDIILLLVQRGIMGNVRQLVTGMDIPRGLTNKKSKTKAQWDKIKKRLESGNESEYKIAIIEADKIIDDFIKHLKYAGENMGDRIGNIPKGQIDNMDEIKEAHEIRNKIIHEEAFSINYEDAKEVLGKYEHFLRHFEVLD